MKDECPLVSDTNGCRFFRSGNGRSVQRLHHSICVCVQTWDEHVQSETFLCPAVKHMVQQRMDRRESLSLISVFRWRPAAGHMQSQIIFLHVASALNTALWRFTDEGALRTHWPSLIMCRLFLVQERLPQLTFVQDLWMLNFFNHQCRWRTFLFKRVRQFWAASQSGFEGKVCEPELNRISSRTISSKTSYF